MKKTQWIDLWTTIRRNRIPYLAIVIFVTLGIALYGGLSWACTYIERSLAQTCDDTRLAHMRVTYPYGISDEQLDELLEIDGVDDAEGYNYIYRFFELNGERCQAVIYQMTERVGALSVVSGTLPEKENEIAVLQSWAKDNNISVGDTVTLLDDYGSDYRATRAVTSIIAWDPEGDEEPDTDTSDPGYLKTNTFTVTALVESPEYLMAMKAGYGSNTMNGVQVDAVMFVTKDAMDPEMFNGYTSAAIFSETLAEMNDGSAAYDAAYDELEAAVKAVTDTWTEIPDSYRAVLERFLQLLNDAAEQISDAAALIEEKQEELDDGQQAVTEGEATLAASEEEYNAGKAQYDAGMAAAKGSAAQLSSAWSTYNSLKEIISAATALKNDMAAFLAVMAEGDGTEENDPAAEENVPAGGEETSGEESGEETDPAAQPDSDEQAAVSGQGAASELPEDSGSRTAGEDQTADEEQSGSGKITQAQKRQAAADAVRASASRLNGLLNANADKISGLSDELGEAVDLDGMYAVCSRLMNSRTPEEMQAAIAAAGNWATAAAANIQSLLDELYTKLSRAQFQLNRAYSRLNKAAAQLEDALRQLNEGRTALDEAIAQLEEGRRALSAALDELAEKQAELEKATKLYNELDRSSGAVYDVMPTVFTRSANIALASADGVREVLENARTTLASLFLIVAVLVGYTTLSRMVADTTLQIGTKKALGFTRWETLRLYLLYAVSAAVIGALLGTAGAYGVELVFNATFNSMYEVEEMPAVVTALPVLIPFLAELVMLVAVVVLASLRQLNRKAIDLLKGTSETEAPKKQPVLTRLFRRMPLLDHIILANLRQDKRRVIAMLIGIGGSAMLITAGLTCLVNMGRSVDLQYSRYFRFDTVIRYDPEDEDVSDEMRALLDEYGVPYAEVCYTHVLTGSESGVTRIPDVFVTDDAEELARVMLFSTEKGKSTDFTGGLWVADSYYEKLGMRTGDTVTLQSLQGEKADFAITGFYKNYLPSLTMVADWDTWLAAYPDTELNAFLVSTDGIDAAALQEALYGLDGYICSIPFRENSQTAFSSILAIIAAIACIFSVMAVLLLLMLLVNLLDMYIAEKKRELIVLKINGYPERKVRQYIWKDTLLLTAAGIFIGIVLGTLEGNFTQSSLEGSTMYMYHGISWAACAAAFAVTGLLALLITLAELRKVDRFRLSDINN